jgi:HemY protein
MRGLFIIILLMLLGGVGLVAMIEDDPGYVLISYGLWTVESSLWVGLLLLLLFYFAVHLVVRFFLRLIASRSVFADWMSKRAYSRQLARCQMQLDAGLYQEVIDTVELSGKLHDQELRLLARAHVGLKDWRALLKLMSKLRKQKVFGERELAALEERAYMGLLSEAAAVDLESTWSGLPARYRKNATFIEHYVERLLDAEEDLQAQRVLARALKREWNDSLVTQYGLIKGGDPARRLKRAESWLKQHPDDASLLLCLGRLSLRNNLWGQAREHFEASHRLRPSAEACAELARLLFSLGERELSAQYYRDGLLLRENNLPELPQPRPQMLLTG